MSRQDSTLKGLMSYREESLVLNIQQETGGNTRSLLPLLEAYRTEYGYPCDQRCVNEFLSDRIYFHDSVIYSAYVAGEAVGFVQMYPIYTLLELKKSWVLNDLFVVPDQRRKGVGQALPQKAIGVINDTNAKELILQAPVATGAGRAFCESQGLCPDTARFYYKYQSTGG